MSTASRPHCALLERALSVRRWRIAVCGAIAVALVVPPFAVFGAMLSGKAFDNRCSGRAGELVIGWWPPVVRCPILGEPDSRVFLSTHDIASTPGPSASSYWSRPCCSTQLARPLRLRGSPLPARDVRAVGEHQAGRSAARDCTCSRPSEPPPARKLTGAPRDPALRPLGDRIDHWREGPLFVGEVIFDANRRRRVYRPREDAMALQLPQALGEHLVAEARDDRLDVDLPAMALEERPQDRAGPAGADQLGPSGFPWALAIIGGEPERFARSSTSTASGRRRRT